MTHRVFLLSNIGDLHWDHRDVFVDDLEANVDTALRRGWRGIVHEDRDLTVARLRELGLPA